MEAGAVGEQKEKGNDTWLKITGVGCRHRLWEEKEEQEQALTGHALVGRRLLRASFTSRQMTIMVAKTS